MQSVIYLTLFHLEFRDNPQALDQIGAFCHPVAEVEDLKVARLSDERMREFQCEDTQNAREAK